MKAYFATFHGDLEMNENLSPLVDSTLEGLLNQIVELTGWGTVIHEKDQNDFWHEYDYCCTPDPEDDKVEIWEIDGENGTAKIVSGFWGWHWNPPDGNYDLQMVLPGHTKTLYELAMEDY